VLRLWTGWYVRRILCDGGLPSVWGKGCQGEDSSHYGCIV